MVLVEESQRPVSSPSLVIENSHKVSTGDQAASANGEQPCEQCSSHLPCPFVGTDTKANQNLSKSMQSPGAETVSDTGPEKTNPLLEPLKHDGPGLAQASACADEVVPCEQCSLHQSCPNAASQPAWAETGTEGLDNLLGHLSIGVMSSADVGSEQQESTRASLALETHRNNIPQTLAHPNSSATDQQRNKHLDHDMTQFKTSFRWQSLSRRILWASGHRPRIPGQRLQLHKSEQSCWLAAEGRVYDATLFLKCHPAGNMIILKYAGTDCSEDFAFHSAQGQVMWSQHLIGWLAEEEEDESDPNSALKKLVPAGSPESAGRKGSM